MEDERDLPKRPWDTCLEVPVIADQQTPWKLIRLLRIVTLCAVALIVFGLALCSKVSFLLLITLSNEGAQTLPDAQRPAALLCIGCCLVASSVLLLLKSSWKACYKTSKLPGKTTAALVLFFELVVSLGAAVLTVVAMPHLDIVTNVTMLNGVAVLSSLLQVISQCSAKERNRLLLPSVAAFLFLLLGYILFLCLYLMKDPADSRTAVWAGLAVAASFLVSFNWWENYFRLMGENSRSDFLRNLCRDMTKSQNMLHIFSSLLRIVVTACVVGAAVPLSQMDWEVLTSIPSGQTRVVVITVGVQLVSSALCHWFALAACKMHALRRCFITPLYLASLGVVVLYVVPVIVYYQDYRTSLNGTAVDFTGYCRDAVDGRNRSLNGSVFPHLVMDVTHTLCFLDMSKMDDIGILTGAAVSWWLGLVLATVHLWYLNLYRIQRTQHLFIRRLYEGAFIEQSLLLNTRFDIQTKDKVKREFETVMVYLCATMWHETYEEMMNTIISVFRLDKYRPNKDRKFNDVTFEAHIYFDDAFKSVEGSEGNQLNEFASNLVGILAEVYGIFTNIDEKFFKNTQQVPDQTVTRTPYGGRLVVTMPHGNNIVVHLKNKDLIRHKKRWSQVMYLYYLLGFKLMSKYYERWQKGEDERYLTAQVQREKHNTYILALDGDTDFQPAAVMLLIDRLKMYPRVGAACGRIHPTGSGPAVWFQKFEYAVSHWLQKAAEHVFGCVLCSPGCFSLFRAEALMDDNVMKKYSTKSAEASHYVQYDQGEDRWLCTLLLKQGWRVEYNAASDAYTNAPEDFKELYNQRRRWGPSTLANIMDLLGDTTMISKRNQSISRPFMFYQLFSITSAILAPATVCLLITGSLSFVFDIQPNGALVMAVIPPVIYLIICFKLKADTQVKVAGVFSVIYAILMLVVMMSIIASMIRDKTILTPSSIFIIAMAFIYFITALMHPQEGHLVFYGFLYILCIPSAYLLLTIYSMVNLNNVSWGTRETKPADGPAAPEVKQQTAAQKAKSSFQRFFSSLKCCKKSRSREAQFRSSQGNLVPQPQNTIVDVGIHGIEEIQIPAHCWITEVNNITTDMQLQEEPLDQTEEIFWKELLEKYLHPLPDDKKRQKVISNDLRELRNKVNFAFFILNALWLVATFTLQLLEGSFSIRLPKVNMDLEYTGEDIKVDPVAFMFILGFGTSVVIQFIAMFYHRVHTLIHYVAFLDTEPKEVKPEPEDLYLPEKRDESTSQADSSSGFNESESEYEDSEEERSSSSLNSNDGGTMV